MSTRDHTTSPPAHDDALHASARVFLNDLLQLQPGEDVLIYTDQASDQRVAQAIRAQAVRQGHRAEILDLDAGTPLTEQAKHLATYIRRGRFRAICELSEQYFYLTEAWPAAHESGARAYSLAGLDAPAFIRCIGQVDHQRMFALGMALRERLLTSRRLEIRSANGTDISVKLGWGPADRLLAKIRRGPRAYMTYPSGYRGGFLGGQLAFRGIPHTIEGTAVVDAYVWPPKEIGPLQEPIVLEFRAGRLVDIGGNPDHAKLLTRWFDGVTVLIEHLCLGFNPGARFAGKIMEAERVFGCLSIGIGPGLRHSDGVIRHPSLYLDGTAIEENGAFVTQELATLARELLTCAGADR